jgi:uncharacterized protein YdiU (UPF0061 family)
MQVNEIDMTLFYRELSVKSTRVFSDFWNVIIKVTYSDGKLIEKNKGNWESWFGKYQSFLASESIEEVDRQNKMKLINPKYVLRNYMAQLAIDDAEKGNFELIDELYQMLLTPYSEQPEHEKWYAKRPDWAKNKVGCSQLSCSS